MVQQSTGSALRVVEALENADVAGVRAELSGRLADWDPEPWIEDRWRPRLAELAGPTHMITDTRPVNDAMARVIVDGDRGRAYVSVLFDAEGKVAGLGIDPDEADARFWVIIGCSREQSDRLEAFYAALTDGPIGFGEGGADPPRWGDPARPAQLHLDLVVDDLDAAERAVVDLGATKLAEFPDHHVYADPAGHPFCLYAGGTGPSGRLAVLTRIVIDCDDPAPLARFWGGLLAMPVEVEVETSGDRIVVAREDRSLPMIAAQRVVDYHSPRWPDPAHPAQLHFDLGFDDRPRREELALALGATLLPPQGGSCPVYADPAGHPFCLCYKGE